MLARDTKSMGKSFILSTEKKRKKKIQKFYCLLGKKWHGKGRQARRQTSMKKIASDVQ